MLNPEIGENQFSYFSGGFMSLPFKELYEFGEFRLNPEEKILMRRDTPVEITPKGFEILCLFVENHGRLLNKDELMDKIWANSFVEESNLTFNIRQLRKILGDDAHDPKYIKTVRRHGYRFIAEVRRISQENSLDTENRIDTPAQLIAEKTEVDISETAASTSAKSRKTFPKKQLLLMTTLIVILGCGIFGAWYLKNKAFQTNIPILTAPFSAEKLSTNGKVVLARLSPDGKNVVYVNGRGGDRQSVWLRQLENGSNTEIIPPSDDVYFGVNLSPDGNTLYFVRTPRSSSSGASIFKVSIFGGIPQKIIGETEGWTSLSPDGARISFVRCPHLDDEYCSLWTADAADGKNERKLISRPKPFRIGDNKFSPDGKKIAFAVGQSENSGNEFGLAEVDLDSGTERALTSEKFFNIKNLAWLPDQSGWLLTASRIPNISVRVWQVSADDGTATALTKDSENYGVLSIDKEATKLVSTQIKHNFQMRLCQTESPTACRVLADAGGATFAPDGKIYFPSLMSGSFEMWSVHADGSNQRQLTNNKADISMPVIARDGGSIYFSSNQSGTAHVWRMNPDGTNQTQITRETGGYPQGVSADGTWIYYLHAINRTLWRVSANGGTEQMVLNKAKSFFAISPDGTRAAFSETEGERRFLAVASLDDGQIVKTFKLSGEKSRLLSVVWQPDGKNLLYVSSNPTYENNVLWRQSLDAETPEQLASLGNDELRNQLSIAPDGKTFTIVQGKWTHDVVLLKGLQ